MDTSNSSSRSGSNDLISFYFSVLYGTRVNRVDIKISVRIFIGEKPCDWQDPTISGTSWEKSQALPMDRYMLIHAIPLAVGHADNKPRWGHWGHWFSQAVCTVTRSNQVLVSRTVSELSTVVIVRLVLWHWQSSTDTVCAMTMSTVATSTIKCTMYIFLQVQICKARCQVLNRLSHCRACICLHVLRIKMACPVTVNSVQWFVGNAYLVDWLSALAMYRWFSFSERFGMTILIRVCYPRLLTLAPRSSASREYFIYW